MYLAIIMLPLLGSIVSGFFGRKVGVTGSQVITCGSVLVTSMLSVLAFIEVGLNNTPVSVQLFRWVDSESLNVFWSFNFDSLTVSMLIPVLIVSLLVHIYSIGYMAHDPHNQRFFSYLSLFTFMMIILVTSDNYLLMFVGWEGEHLRLKWFNYIFITYPIWVYLVSLMVLVDFYLFGLNCSQSKKKYINPQLISRLRSDLRIGPHNEDVISVIIGSILGDSHLEKKKNGIGTRIIFEQCNRNVEYIMWFHNFFASKGYCSNNKPKLTTKINKDNKVFFQYRVSSYTFTSLNWLHNMFYINNGENYVKVIPNKLHKFLTPLALAIWFMDDGSKTYNTVRLATNNFTHEECIFLCKLLKDKYNLNLTVQSSGKNKGYILYVMVNSYDSFVSIIKPHMIPSMLYKLGI